MKAIAIKEFVKNYADLRVTDVPNPNPADDEILVDVTHTALNHVDLLYCRGKHQNNHSGLVSPPFILGLEFAGIVRSAPDGSKFRTGDHVWGSGVGGFAEQIAVKESLLQKVPVGWSLEDVAGLGAATAPVSYGALIHVAKLQHGETVLIHAAGGGMGVVAVQIAKAVGAKVVATVGSDAKAKVVSELGADIVIRYDAPQWEKEVQKATGGKGVDVAFDTVGLVEKSLRCLKFGGRVVIAGFAGLEGNMEKVAMNRILLKGAIVLGYRYGETGRRDPAENAAIWQGLNAMLARGHIRPAVYETYQGLERVPQAMEALAGRKVWGKAVVKIRPRQLSHSKM